MPDTMMGETEYAFLTGRKTLPVAEIVDTLLSLSRTHRYTVSYGDKRREVNAANAHLADVLEAAAYLCMPKLLDLHFDRTTQVLTYRGMIDRRSFIAARGDVIAPLLRDLDAQLRRRLAEATEQP